MDLGDRTEDSTIDFKFSTRNVSAAPATLAGTPVLSVYKANGTTESTAGITLTVDFDSLTGLNHVRLVTTDPFYAAANDYEVVITTGTVNSVSVVGTTIATFSIENRFMRGTDSALLAADINLTAGAVDNVTTVATTTTNTDMVGTDNAATAAALVVVGLNVLALQGVGFVTGTDSNEAIKNTIDGLNDFNPSSDDVAVVTLVDTTTTNTDMVGTDDAFLAASAPTNFGDLAITSTTGKITVGDVLLADGVNLDLGLIDKGTGQAATATTFTGRAAQPNDSVVAGQTLVVFGSTQGFAQSVLIDSVSGDVFTVAAWPTGITPAGTLTYVVFASPTASPNALPDVSIGEILGAAITESSAGRIAGNFDVFYDNADAQTTQVVDDVGGGGGGTDWTSGEREEIRGRLGVTGTTAAGGNTPTLSLQTSVDAIPTTAMRGTDSAATSVKQDTMETTLNAIPTTAMRGTDSAATATALATAQLDLDTITGSDGATLATSQPNEDFGAVRKNATFSNFTFLMVLTSDHVTPAAGLTVTGERSLDAGAFAGVSGTITEISNGIYQFDALAADTNGDTLNWRFSSATADDTFINIKTVE